MKYDSDFVPAFPQHDSDDMGMSIRCYLAGQAMIGLIINPSTLHPTVPLSARACEIADALLAELAKEKT